MGGFLIKGIFQILAREGDKSFGDLYIYKEIFRHTEGTISLKA